MLGKIFSETVAKVRTKADEVRTSVGSQAALKAVQEVLGFPQRNLTVSELELHVEREASHPQGLTSLDELYRKWLTQIRQSGKDGLLFLDDTEAETDDIAAASQPPTASQPQDVSSNEKKTEEGEVVLLSAPPEISSSSLGPPSYLTFKQVLLRSRALELSLVNVAKMEGQTREALVGPLEEGEEVENSPRATVQNLLSLLLRGDTKLHMELIFMFCTADASNDRHLLYLGRLVSLLKVDWQDDLYFEVRRRLAGDIEQLKIEIHQNEIPPLFALTSSPSEGSSDRKENSATVDEGVDTMSILVASDQHNRRVRNSADLIELYTATKANLEKSAECRQAHHLHVKNRLEALLTKLGGSAKDCEAAHEGAHTRTSSLQEEMMKAGEDVVEEMMVVEKKREEVDSNIAKLEDEKQKLMIQVDALNKRIEDLQEIQRKSLNATDRLREELDAVRRRYRTKLATEEALKTHSEAAKMDLHNIQTVALQTKEQLDVLLAVLAEDLESKSKKILCPIEDLRLKHVTYQQSRLVHHREVLLFLIRQLKQLRPQVDQFLAQPSQHQRPDSDPLEARGKFLQAKLLDARHKFARAVADLDVFWAETQDFKKETLAAEVPLGQTSFVSTFQEAMLSVEKIYSDIKTTVVAPNNHLLAYVPHPSPPPPPPSSHDKEEDAPPLLTSAPTTTSPVVPELVDLTKQQGKPASQPVE